jgi:hypothetical protein
MTSRAFHAYCVYRDLGHERSLVKLAAKLGKHVSQMEAWSSRYGWQQRLRDEDRQVAVLQAEALHLAHAAVAEALRSMGMERLTTRAGQGEPGDVPAS